MKEIQIKKKNIYLVIILIVILIGVFYLKPNISTQKQYPEIINLEAKFAVLSNANSNSCGGTFNYVDSMSDNSRIQGSCCSAMDFHMYSEQIEGLKKYKYIEKIPTDPYDVPVSLAKELLDYQKEIVLINEEQDIYDKAMEMSMEDGPCCCKCWHWYAYEGLAKYLITEYDFDAEQVAEIWDLSDACGGSGHEHES